MITSQETGSYLKFIFNEDIYIINEASKETNVKAENSTTNIPLKKQEEVSPLKIYKVGIVANPKEVEKYKEFLTKLLGAINIDWNNASIIESPLPSLANYESFIIFGLENQHLVSFNAAIIPNEPLKQGNQKFLFTFSLSELDNNNTRKGILWGGLKKAYSI